MKVKINRIGEGLHPNEVVVEVATSDGTQNLVVDRRAIEDEAISVGAPLQQDHDRGLLLVELPRETMNGAWRVWVKKDTLIPDTRAA